MNHATIQPKSGKTDATDKTEEKCQNIISGGDNVLTDNNSRRKAMDSVTIKILLDVYRCDIIKMR